MRELYIILVFSSLLTNVIGQNDLSNFNIDPPSLPSLKIEKQLELKKRLYGISQRWILFEELKEEETEIHLRNSVQSANFLKLIPQAVFDLTLNKPKTISITLKLPDGEMVELELFEKSIWSENAIIRTSDGLLLTPKLNVHYRGVVKGFEGSMAGFSFFEDEVVGVLNLPTKGTYVLGLLEGQREIHVIYNANDLPQDLDFRCGVKPEWESSEPIEIQGNRRGQRSLDNCIKVYLEADYALFQNKGGTQQTINYVTGIFNNVAIIYNNEDINTEISEIFVWTTPDNYSQWNAGDALNQFMSARQNFNGNLAHLLALGGNGLGGLAWVDVLCNKSLAFAYSNIWSSYQNFPTYSWTIMVVAHEMGHNVGSPHTQWCGWPGGAIDDCYQTEGGCPPGPPPTNGGTIMSYCHLTHHGINLANGFGFHPGNLIRDRVENGSCLTACSGLCDQFSASFTLSHTTCGNNDGIIQITPTGGQAPYMYSIGQGFSQHNTFSNLPAGIYHVTIIDDNDCEIEYTVEINPSTPLVVQPIITPTSCGEPNGRIEALVISGNPPYVYNLGFQPVFDPVFYPLKAGWYELVVLDNDDCRFSESIFIEPSDHLQVELDVRHTTCGRANGRVIISATGGTPPYLYTYNGLYRSNPVFDSLPPGQYSFEVKDVFDCSFTVPVQIQSSSGVQASAQVIPTACVESNGKIIIEVSQGKSPFQYRLNNQQQATPVFTGLSSGTYQWSVTDSSGCAFSASSTVALTHTLSLQTNIIHPSCGLNNGSIEILPLNGVPAFEYLSGQDWLPLVLLDELSQGTYQITVRDQNNCPGNLSLNLIGTDPPVFDWSASASQCNLPTGSLSIEVSSGQGPFQYFLNLNSSQQPYFDSLYSGQYLIRVVDSLGCETRDTGFVPGFPGFGVDIQINHISCGDTQGSAMATAAGGQEPYLYDIGMGPQGQGLFENLTAGFYTLTVKDAFNCTYQSFFEVLSLADLILALEVVNTSCGKDNGSIKLSVSGGSGNIQYFVNGSEFLGQELIELSPGLYTIRAVDEDGCIAEKSAEIQASTPLTVTIEKFDPTCENDNGQIVFDIENGTSPFLYNIGQGDQNSNIFIDLAEGRYHATVTDANLCQWQGDIDLVNQGNKPKVEFYVIRSGLDVYIINRSSGNSHRWEWDFGDGNQSSSYSPTHRYAALGDYSVCLIMENYCGASQLCKDIQLDASSDCNQQDSLALIALFENTKGIDWDKSWDLNNPIATWHGVLVDQTGCVLALSLPSNNLVGQIPNEIGQLAVVNTINLSGNQLAGDLPDDLTRLYLLQSLDLSQNNLSGTLPPNIRQWEVINSINLRSNALSGIIPKEIFEYRWLNTLILGNNQFEGTLADQITYSADLRYLDLSSNRLQGNIPDGLKSINNLEYLYLNDNNFAGSVPDLGLLSNLKALWLSNNQLEALPDLTPLVNLEDAESTGLRVDSNKFTFKDLVPNIDLWDKGQHFIYHPQSKVYKDTSIQLQAGETLYLDIDVDTGVQSVLYHWYKNGVFWKQSDLPVLNIQSFEGSDAGIYHCEITHPLLPKLTLYSRDITLDFISATEDINREDAMKVFPNPVSTGDFLYCEVKNLERFPIRYEYIDLSGKILCTGDLEIADNQSVYSFKIPPRPGIYVLRFVLKNDEARVFKIVVIE